MGMIVRKTTWDCSTIYHSSNSTWMCLWKLGSMVRINGLCHLLINVIYWGYNPLILTFDPSTSRPNPGHPKYAILIKARDECMHLFQHMLGPIKTSHIMVHIEKKKRKSLTDGMVQRGEQTCIKRRHQSSAPVWMFAEHVQFYPNSLMSGCFSPSKKDGNIVPKKTESFSRCYTLFRCYYHG